MIATDKMKRRWTVLALGVVFFLTISVLAGSLLSAVSSPSIAFERNNSKTEAGLTNTACFETTPSATPSSTSLPVVLKFASSTPTATGTRTATPMSPTPSGTVQVHEESVTLGVYPYESFWSDAYDATYNITYKRFDAAAYFAAPRSPTPRTFKTIIFENTFLKLTFLPDIGGRLWQVLYKPTNQTVFYNNTVLKPTYWGPTQQGGWLGIGGMEWALPVDEHGYEWGVPWAYTIEQTTGQAAIAFRDTESNTRVRAVVTVTLPVDVAFFVVHPRLENPTGSALDLQFWVNTQLALNVKNIAPQTEFVLSTGQVLVHSNDNSFIPTQYVPPPGATAPTTPMPWPLVGNHNLGRYSGWENYLGVFVPTQTVDFAGAYNGANGLGIARVFDHTTVPGVKLFAFGPEFNGRSQFADDGSDYFELWGGLPRTFFKSDNVRFSANSVKEWDEYWVPFSQTGGLSAATQQAVLYLFVNASRVASVGAAASSANTRGDLILYRDNVEVKRWSVVLSPSSTFRDQVSVPSAGQFKLRLIAQGGAILAETP